MDIDTLMDIEISIEVEIAPAYDSPKNILNVLNDDCIQLIFRKMDNIRDFLSAAETCTRFQENAKLTFRTQFKSVRIGELYEGATYNKETVTVDRSESFLSIFGYLITEVDFDRRADPAIDDHIQQMIARCCGRTMTSFKLASCDSVVNFNTQSPLQALQTLDIYCTNILNFEYHTQLRSLLVSGMRTNYFDWLIQPFPQLESVKFYILHELQNNQAIDFLKLNPQLKCLVIEFCSQITPLLFENIATFAPNIEKLSIWLSNNRSSGFNDRLLHISKLQKLKSLIILSYSLCPLARLVNCLIENNVAIEEFGIFEKYPWTHELNIPELKLLKKLCLSQMTDETLIKFVKKLPALKVMMATLSPNITVKGIKGALEHGKQLTVFLIDTKNIVLDLDDYNSILRLARGRVKVHINIEFGSINVPSDLLEANCKWLKITDGGSHVISTDIRQDWF